MSDIGKILAGLFAITVISVGGVSLFGGITLFEFNKTEEAPRPLTKEEKEDNAKFSAKEKKDNADLEAKSKGDDALKEDKYLNAIHFYSGISDDSEVVSNKADLVEMATKEYISYILSEVNNALENDNFDKAQSLIEEALKEVYENEELTNKLSYVSLREELHSLTLKEKPEIIINYINDNMEIFGNDKRVSETYRDFKNIYLNNVISDSNKSIDNHKYDVARNMLDSAEKLIGLDSKISDQRTNIKKKEIDYNISVFTNNEDWYGLYQYIDSFEGSLKNNNLYKQKNAKSKLIDIAISDSRKYLQDKEYELAKSVLSELIQKIGNDEKIDNQYKLIEKTIIEDNISEMKNKESWRDLIDYLNSLSDQEKYESDYSNAVSKYKAAIIKEAKEYIQSEDYYSAYNILVSAYDILVDDNEYLELYEECNNSI